MMVYACCLVNGVRLVTEIIFERSSNNVNMRLTAPSQFYLEIFHHALSMIVNI